MSFKTSTKILDSVSMGASFNSQELALDFVSGFSIHAVFSGSPNGTFKLQASNDDASTPTNWIDIADSSQNINSSGSIMWLHTEARFKWVRVSYSRNSGTGSVDAIVVTKEIKYG